MDLNDLLSIISSDNPVIKIKENEKMLFEIIPELEKCKGFNQNNHWHQYDVYEHIINVVGGVAPNLVLRLSALFHDIGKPKAYFEDENGIGHFTGHWFESQVIFESFATKHGLDEKLAKLVSLLILYHDKHLDNLEDKDNLFIIEQFDIDGINNLFSLKKADLLAQNKKYHYLLDEYNKQQKAILLLKV